MKKIWKRTLSLLLVVLMVGGAAPVNTFLSDHGFKAQALDQFGEYSSGEWCYNVLEDGASITEYVGHETEIEIPSEIDGFPVTEIHCTFQGPRHIRSIFIPDSVRRIPWDCFYQCKELAEITGGRNLESCVQQNLTATAFYQDESNWTDGILYLGTVAIASNESLPSHVVFRPGTTYISTGFLNRDNQKQIISVFFPKSVSYIGDNAFSTCLNLQTITFENNSVLKVIGKSAFEYCKKLNHVSLPHGLEIIRTYAFASCEQMDSISLPPGLEEIGGGAFRGVPALDDKNNCEFYVDVPGWGTTGCGGVYKDGYLLGFRYGDTWAKYVADSSKTYRVKEGTELIADAVSTGFGNGLASAENLIFPSSVRHICESSCEFVQNESIAGGLKTVTIPYGVQTIGESAFAYNRNLKTIILPETITHIGAYAFSGSGIQNIKLPKGITKVSRGLFSDCKSLSSVIIPDSVTVVEQYSFGKNVNLTEIQIPKSVTFFGEQAFYGCSSLRQIALPITLKLISEYAFWKCAALTSVIIPENVIGISEGAFAECTGLQNVSFMCDSINIGTSAFKNCSSLTHITLPRDLRGRWSGLTYPRQYDGELSDSIFSGCTNLQWISVPSSIHGIGTSALNDCTALTDIHYEGSAADWKQIRIQSNGNDALKNAAIHYNSFVEDTSVLRLTASSPAKGSTNASFKDDLVLKFNQDVLCHAGAISEIYDYEIAVRNFNTDKTIFSSEALRQTFWGEAVLNGNILTIPHALQNMQLGEKYYLYIGANCFSAKENLSLHFPGITDKNMYTFVCADGISIMHKVTNVKMPVKDDKQIQRGSLSVTFDPLYFEQDSAVYADELADFCAEYLTLGYCYNRQTMIDYLTQIGFSDADAEMQTSREQVNYFIASGNIEIGEKRYMLVFTGLIGSYKEQWYSNFDPGTGSTHQGFNNAKEFIYASPGKGKLGEYLKNIGADKTNTKILIAGHSRGAATANLVAAQLIKDQVYASPDNIYTYAFATPNSTALPERKNDEFKRIFNIVNPTDFVTQVMPTAWMRPFEGKEGQYGRYGTTYTLPSRNNTCSYESEYLPQMLEEYKKIVDWDFNEYANGENPVREIIEAMTKYVKSPEAFYQKEFRIDDNAFGQVTPHEFFRDYIIPLINEDGKSQIADGISLLLISFSPLTSTLYSKFIRFLLWIDGSFSKDFQCSHAMETYCAFMLSTNADDVRQERHWYEICVEWQPPDKDLTGKVWEKQSGLPFHNTAPDVQSGNMFAQNDNDEINTTGVLKFGLPADGDYEVWLTCKETCTTDCSVREIDPASGETKRVNFFDVTIPAGQTVTCDIGGARFDIADSILRMENGETSMPSETLTSAERNALTIRVSADGQGYADSVYNLTRGDYVMLSATAAENNEFLGWYENGVLVSTDTEYAFVAKSNRDLTAKFTVHPTGRVQSVTAPDLICIYKKGNVILPTVTADSGIPYTVTYSGFDSRIISVNADGNVTALKKGSTNVTVTATDEFGHTAEYTCSVTVKYTWWQWLIIIFLFGWIWY